MNYLFGPTMRKCHLSYVWGPKNSPQLPQVQFSAFPKLSTVNCDVAEVNKPRCC